MFCSNCGKQLMEGKKFCIYCGQAVETVVTKPEVVKLTPAPQQPQPTPAQQPTQPTQPMQPTQPTPPPQQSYPPQQPPAPQQPQPEKKKTGLIIALVAAAIVVVVAVILAAFFLVSSCSINSREQTTVEAEQENEVAVDREATDESEDDSGSDAQNGEQEKVVEDDRLSAFEGTLHESTTPPLSFVLPPDYTVDENSDRILCTSPTGLAQVQIYRIAGISAADVQADQESYNLDAITRFNGNLYEYTSEEDVVYYDTTWRRVIFKSNDADGNLINYWFIYTDDGKGGVIFCAYGLFFGPAGTASIDELSGLDIQESIKLS